MSRFAKAFSVLLALVLILGSVVYAQSRMRVMGMMMDCLMMGGMDHGSAAPER